MKTLNLKVFYEARQQLEHHVYSEKEVRIVVYTELLNNLNQNPIISDGTIKKLNVVTVHFKAVKYCYSPNNCWYEWELESWS